MRRSQQRLAIWANGIPVGYRGKHKGEDRLEYHPDWIADSQGGAFVAFVAVHTGESALLWQRSARLF